MPKQEYDPKPFQDLLRALLRQTGESYRQASLAAGLPHNAISKYLRGVRPRRDACVALADHFRVNPNELLKAAGYEPLHLFDRSLIEPGELSPEVKELATRVQRIRDPVVRRRLIEAMKVLVDAYLDAPGSEPATETTKSVPKASEG